jgi:hypothetical protein
MGFFKTIFTAPGRAYRWLYQDEKRLRRKQGGGLASDGEPDADVDYEEQKRMANNFSAWEEIDDMRYNFLIGSWALRRIRGIGTDEFHRDREALAKELAEEKGEEYKSSLQRELEAAMKKREEKERLKAEKQRQKEERKRKA